MTLERHSPPCKDPDCMPCWWDALDREMYSFEEPSPVKVLNFAQQVAKGFWELFHALDGVQVRWRPFNISYQQVRWEDRHGER